MLKNILILGLLAFSNILFADNINYNREKLSPVVAVPANQVTIDGKLSEWSFKNSQIIYVAKEFFENERMEFAFSYDKDALYFAAKVHDLSPLKNIHHVSGRFWEGDSLQLRFYTKLNSKHVPQRRRGVISQDKQIVHANVYYQSTEHKVITRFDYSVNFIETKISPPGVKAAFKLFPNKKGYNVELKLPWKVLNMKKAPMPGDNIRALVEINFSDATGQKRVRRTSGVYNKNPGDFGFLGGDNWGTIHFVAKPVTQRSYPAAKAIAATISRGKGLKIPVKFPFKACASINIKDKSGSIIREIVVNKEHAAGTYNFIWNGKNNAGMDVPLGKYFYQVLFYKKLKAEYKGSTASSGTPPFGTPDGTGEWGGDHSNPLAVSIDSKGMTLLWPIAELGKAIVRLDNNDKVMWRYTPFFDASGNFYTMASDGQYIYLTYETPSKKPKIFRLNASNGAPAFFEKNKKAIDLAVNKVKREKVSSQARATAFDLIASGMTVDSKYIYVAIYPNNEILVLNKKNAKLIKRITIPCPRGLACSPKGGVYVISYPKTGKGAVYKITLTGKAVKIIDDKLSAPWNIAVKTNGNIVLTDLGNSQQVKEFKPNGQLIRVWGNQGGRPSSGKYKTGNFLKPSGIAADNNGNIVVVESSIPSVISRINKNGKITKQWFGPANYAHAVWADAKDPFKIYSLVPGGILLSRLNPLTKAWKPEAYWSFTTSRAKREQKHGGTMKICSYDYFKDKYFQNFTGAISYPQNTMLKGFQYMSSDSAEHPIVRVDGINIFPIATCFAQDGKVFIAHDLNHNGIIDKNEIEEAKNIPAIADKKPAKLLNGHTGSHTLSQYSGNWYIAGGKKIYKIPLKSINRGQLIFDSDKAGVFIDDITDGDYKKPLPSGHRAGILGMREDSHRNLYVVYTYSGKSLGIGHSSDIRRVFIAKFDKTGKRLWTAGRKARSFAKPGEVYNPWIMAGLLNDKLIAFSDETGGMIHFYDANGFYRGKIFKDYARGDAQPGPYLFHGENFSGRVQYYPKLKKYMAYQGMTDSRVFELKNVDAKTKLETGSIELLRHYSDPKKQKTATAEMIRLKTQLALNADDAKWRSITPIKIKDIALLRLAATSKELFFEFTVKDKSPLLNSEADPTMAFKGGDALDLYFGKNNKRKNNQPILGDVRILISSFNGAVRITGMKVISDGIKEKITYTNPGGYKRNFDYVGAIKNAQGVAVKTDDGYRVRGVIPLEFLKPLSFVAGEKLKFDADILQSDAAGQKTVNRIFWHASGDSQLTMTQDIPTECYLYPEYWGSIKIK